MKKILRMITVAVSIIIMLASIIVGLGVILAVKNINVTLYSYGYNALIAQGYSEEEALASEAEKADGQEQVLLAEFKGQLITSITAEDIEEVVKSYGYKLQSAQRSFPCTINVVIYEQTEAFAIKGSSGYDIYNDDGEFMYSSEENVNSYDGAPNIVLSCTEKGSAVDITQKVSVEDIAKYCSYFRSSFGSLRNLVESIDVIYEGTGETLSHLIFRMHSGVDIRIVNFEEDADKKISKAYECYQQLTGAQKLTGEVYSIMAYNGEINSAYQKSQY